ncbi:hypothetical protein P344_00870 [Spiroplasma mirum ATCC 29335]|uniref:Uncharacterized protein n=2 Tax=Spiroplasma mirum TaxID=2144 RepID=W0GPR6_9MOLU|nr:anaerobic ribonucleoside-triphosphate reductase activating protein [Spiroplasma mirum]AHF60604.1 anaerobic ribonucleoside-triphosphate reductase activating protein [Spiroplasma mirum ATCC 29335]AHI57547.1 hypothetical protein P344_00870 [Spiroplasma mirum ATCC 29335]
MELTKINNFNIKVLKIYPETTSDGLGLCYSIYLVAGCRHACFGCHNVRSWNHNNGQLLDDKYLAEIIDQINANSLLEGVTLSGEVIRFYDSLFLRQLLEYFKKYTNKNIWCYTGYTYEQIINKPELNACLKYIDVLIDAWFVLELRDILLPFKDSSNQRTIYLKNCKLDFIDNYLEIIKSSIFIFKGILFLLVKLFMRN